MKKHKSIQNMHAVYWQLASELTGRSVGTLKRMKRNGTIERLN